MKKIDAVCGILFEDGKILTVSRKDDHRQLGLPGGKVDKNELKVNAVVRECLEETGILTEVEPRDKFTDMIGEYEVTCFKLNKISEEIRPVSEQETGKVEFVDIIKLLTNSPFAEYNFKALAYFGYNEIFNFDEILKSKVNDRYFLVGLDQQVEEILEKLNDVDLGNLHTLLTYQDETILFNYFTALANQFDFSDTEINGGLIEVIASDLQQIYDDWTNAKFVKPTRILNHLRTLRSLRKRNTNIRVRLLREMGKEYE